MPIPEFWECDTCGRAQTHQTHLAHRNEWMTEHGGFYKKSMWLCDRCFKAVGGTCDNDR